MISNHLILCHSLLFFLQSFPASGSFPVSRLFMLELGMKPGQSPCHQCEGGWGSLVLPWVWLYNMLLHPAGIFCTQQPWELRMAKVKLRKGDMWTVISLLQLLPLLPQEEEKHLVHGETSKCCGPSRSGGHVPQSGTCSSSWARAQGKATFLQEGLWRRGSLQDKSRVGHLQCFSLGITGLVSWGRDWVFVNQFTAWASGTNSRNSERDNRGILGGETLVGRPALTFFHFDFLLCFPVPNQMHYHIFSLITISGGNSLLLIQLKD